jgi:hypothetical protein
MEIYCWRNEEKVNIGKAANDDDELKGFYKKSLQFGIERLELEKLNII